MNREQYRKAINDLVNNLEQEESLKAVHQTALICHDNELNEKEKRARHSTEN